MEKMKIVFLDRKTIGDDIDLAGFSRFGEVVTYDFTYPDEVPERVIDADILVINKIPVNKETIGRAGNLKLICVTATGTNNLDKEYLAKRGIEWRNVAGYSTECVAQHTFALMFELLEHISYYDNYVKSESYVGDRLFSHFEKTFHELNSMRWGIVGLGTIGKRVADLAAAFGCDVIYYSTSGRNHDSHYNEVDFDTLLGTSDIISIHAPLDDNTRHLFDKRAFDVMKKSAILINVGRGPIIVEEDLANALQAGHIAAAGLDVLDFEPMRADNPLKPIKDTGRLLITPHIAWAGIETRKRLMSIIEGQVEEWLVSRVIHIFN